MNALLALICPSCHAETLSIAPVKNPSVIICASYTVFVNTCKAMKCSSCFGILFHMIHAGLAYAMYMVFYNPLCRFFQPCCHTPTLFVIISCAVYCGLPKPCVALGRSGSLGISQQEREVGVQKPGPVPGGGDLVMELWLANRYCRCDNPDAC